MLKMLFLIKTLRNDMKQHAIIIRPQLNDFAHNFNAIFVTSLNSHDSFVEKGVTSF